MSFDLIVNTNRASVPTSDEMESAASAAIPSLRFQVPADFSRHEGHMPVLHGARETGFEVLLSDITEEDRADYLSDEGESEEATDGLYWTVLTSCDRQITLCCDDEPAIEAARPVAMLLARLSGGYFCDPQTGLLVKADAMDPSP